MVTCRSIRGEVLRSFTLCIGCRMRWGVGVRMNLTGWRREKDEHPVMKQFREVKEGDGKWQMPRFLMRGLWRDGVRV
jgi:hypothetical protein